MIPDIYRLMLMRTAVLLCGVFLLAATGAAYANPSGGVVSAGSAGISSAGDTLTVTQTSNRAVIDWQSFNIGTNETTTFVQPSASSMTLNRIGGQDPSQILGTLTANGKIYLVNPNGLVFGKDAQVNVGSLLATTANIRNDDFMAGNMAFTQAGNADGYITNAGTITAAEAGLVGFVAPTVVNNGIITARLGRVSLASGDTLTMDMYGDNLVNVAVSNETAQHLAANGGIIAANGGTVALTAAAGQTIANGIVYNSGIIQADSVAQQNGKIILYAEGSNAVQGNVAADKGKKSGSSTVLVTGTLSATGANAGETGGSITVSGDTVDVGATALIGASGRAGGGDIKIGGDYLGSGDTPAALAVNILPGAAIYNDAVDTGNGGRTIVWSDGTTYFAGAVFARGGHASGNGGFLETSGHESLTVGGTADLSAADPQNYGTWFLDPLNVTIYNRSGSGDLSSTFTTAQLESMSTGANISLAATNSMNLDFSGDTLTLAANRSLSLSAGGQLTIFSTGAIVTSDGDISLQGTGGIGIGGAFNFTTGGGNLTFDGPVSLYANLAASAGTGTITFTSTIDTGSTLSGNIDALLVGGGGGAGGTDNPAGGAGGGSGGAVVTTVTSGDLSIQVGGGGGGGKSLYTSGGCAGGSAGGAGGAGGGGAGGAAGSSGCSGGGGGGGGFSSLMSGSTYLAVAGGGAGGGGANEGTANDVQAPGAGNNSAVNQPNGTTGTMQGGTGATYSGDGGGGGGGGGGYQGGNGQTNLTSSGKASAGTSYYDPSNISGTLYSGNAGATSGAGGAGGAAVALDSTTAAYFGYDNTAGAGATAINNNYLDGAAGSNGIVILRYDGSPLAVTVSGGTSTTVGGSTIWTFNSNGSLTPVTSVCGGAGCGLSLSGGTINLNGAVGGTQALGTVSLTSANSLSLPSISAANITAQTTGAAADISIASGNTLTATDAGTALTLASAHDFSNAGSLATPNGNWLVYSSDPAADTLGGLDADFVRYSCTYGGSCPTLGTGNGLLYSTTPILTITPTGGATTVYGSAAPSLSNYGYTVSGYLTAADETADSLSGTLNGTTAYVAGDSVGSYDISHLSGTLASSMGYGFNYASNSTGLSVTKAALTVSAPSFTKTFGTALNLGSTPYSVNGLLGTDTVTAVTLASAGAATNAPIGSYSVTASHAVGSGLSNYTISYVPGSVSVTASSLSGALVMNNTAAMQQATALAQSAGTTPMGSTRNLIEITEPLAQLLGIGQDQRFIFTIAPFTSRPVATN